MITAEPKRRAYPRMNTLRPQPVGSSALHTAMLTWLVFAVAAPLWACGASNPHVEAASSAQALTGGAPNVGATCLPQKPDACPARQVCVAENIPELGDRWSCQLACQSDADCDAFTPDSERDCVRLFRAQGQCRCTPGTQFASCARASEPSGPKVCQVGVFQAYPSQPRCQQ
jgi:hypothetical protein